MSRRELQRLESFTAILLGNVEVRPVRDTRLIEIRYRHRLPDLARKIADNWAEAYKDNNFNDIYNTNKDSGRFLDEDDQRLQDQGSAVGGAAAQFPSCQRGDRFWRAREHGYRPTWITQSVAAAGGERA
jgi:hypothetical protein